MVGSGFPKRIGGTKSESPRQRNLAPDRERRVSGMCFGGLTLLVEASADHPLHALLPGNCWLSLAAGCPPHGFFRQEGPANPSGRPKQRHAPTSAFTPRSRAHLFPAPNAASAQKVADLHKNPRGTSKNSASSPNAIKLPANDSASFSFRFIYVHSGA